MAQASRIRRQTVEHTFGMLKAWMGATHLLTKTLAYNLKRAMQIVGIRPLMAALQA
jgi:hypothetical protein